MAASLWAEIVANLRLLLAGLDRARHGLQRLDRGLDAAIQSALEVDRAGPGDDVAHAVRENCMRENRRCAGAVADHVTGFLGRLAEHLGAKVLFGILESNSLAMVTPSLQTIGAPHFLSIRTDFDFGPSVTRIASASCAAPRRIFSRAADRNITRLCAIAASLWSMTCLILA